VAGAFGYALGARDRAAVGPDPLAAAGGGEEAGPGMGRLARRGAMRGLKVVLAAVGLVLATGAMAVGLTLAAPFVGMDPLWGTAIGVAAGVALGAGMLWGALARPASAGPVEAGRFQRLGARAAEGEPGPDRQALPLTARAAIALTDSDRRQHLAGSYVSYLRASGDGLDAGAATAWEVHYFSQAGRRLLRVMAAREGAAYRVTSEMEDLGRWLDKMAPDQQEAAWEALLLRNLELPQDHADSSAVMHAVAAAAAAAGPAGEAFRARTMTAAVARPTLEWAPTVFWIIEAEEGHELYRYYCDVQTAEVLRREQILSAAPRPS